MELPVEIQNKILRFNIHPNAIFVKKFFDRFRHLLDYLDYLNNENQENIHLYEFQITYDDMTDLKINRIISYIKQINFKYFWRVNFNGTYIVLDTKKQNDQGGNYVNLHKY